MHGQTREHLPMNYVSVWVFRTVRGSEEDMENHKVWEIMCLSSAEFVFASCLLNSDIWKQWKYWIAPINSLRASDFPSELRTENKYSFRSRAHTPNIHT